MCSPSDPLEDSFSEFMEVHWRPELVVLQIYKIHELFSINCRWFSVSAHHQPPEAEAFGGELSGSVRLLKYTGQKPYSTDILKDFSNLLIIFES